MKKFHLMLIVMFLLYIESLLFNTHPNAVNYKKIAQSSFSIPDSVMNIFNNSCISCHGKDGKGIAMSQVNFSTWDTYSAEKQNKKANAICNVLTNGSMPPASVRKNDPGRVPTAEQKEIICNWAGTLNVK
jgi:hypothetical protein